MKQKGFSMVEAIISVCILSAISVVLIMGITHAYAYLHKMKGLTADTYVIMQEMENAIQDIRDELELATPDLSGYPTQSYSVFGKTVTTYEVYIAGKYGSAWSLVGENTYGELPVPHITVLAQLMKGNDTTASYLNNDLSVSSTETLNVEDSSLYLMTTYRWYVSKEGYYIRSNDETDYLNSDYYPTFPRDYVAIGGSAGTSEKMDLSLDTYRGRHVLLAATPVANSGKMGTPAVSNPVYISGLPVTGSSLRLHLDASLVGIDDYETYSSASGSIKKWTDFTGHGHNAILIPQGSLIANTTLPFGDTYANVLDFGSGVTAQIESDLEPMSEFTLFAIVYTGSDGISNPFISANSWNLALDSFKLFEDDLMIDGIDNDHWYVLGITANMELGTLSLTVNSGAPQEMSLSDTEPLIDSGKMRLGADGVKLAEIIVYNQVLEADSYGDILDYLLKKYDLR